MGALKLFTDPVCPYCGNNAVLVNGRAIHFFEPDLHDHKFWVCPPCDARVGCHPDTEKPLGRLANAELRAAKVKAHAAFDPLWQSRQMTRSEAYRRLAALMGLKPAETHIGLFNVEQCRQVVRLCQKLREAA